jgi:hypothetical protein
MPFRHGNNLFGKFVQVIKSASLPVVSLSVLLNSYRPTKSTLRGSSLITGLEILSKDSVAAGGGVSIFP